MPSSRGSSQPRDKPKSCLAGRFFTTTELTWTKPEKRKKEREVAQLCPTLCDPTDCSPPGSSVHGILQARMPEWVAISFSRGSSQPRDQTALQAELYPLSHQGRVPSLNQGTLPYCLRLCLWHNVNWHSALWTSLIKLYFTLWASLVAQLVENRRTVWENWVWSLGWEDPVTKGKATHSSILAWRIPWTLQSMGLQRFWTP